MRVLACVAIALLSLSPLDAQKKSAKPSPPAETQTAPTAAPAAAEEAKAEDPTFKGLTWREIGPFRGGRVLAVSGVAGDPNTYYFGAVAGGVWKTADGGTSWSPISDKEKFSSIGAIAVAPSDPNVIYVGTGEACIRGNILGGSGVYKSVDAGKTWKFSGLDDTQAIGRVLVNPKNPDIVFVAALGHVYGASSERGIFRSTDGGKSWQKVLYKDDKTGGIDLAFDPHNPNTIFAALWEAHRTPYSLVSGGPGSGPYRSTDGGSTWKRLEGHGLPEGTLGRIGISVSGADGSRVYALIEAEKGGLYRSEDGGDRWQLISSEHKIRQRPWYFMHIFADPKSADTVYVLNVSMYRSNDGGKTFTQIHAPHGDHHGLWIDPEDPKRMINSNDGGADVTVDGGQTWTSQYNQPTAQFYHVITDNRFPYYIYGAQQDNTTVAIASRGEEGVIDRAEWYPVGGCESGYIAPDPRNANIVYAGCYGGYITRFDKRTGQEQAINVWPLNPIGHGAADLKHRFQWTAPIVFSPHDPSTLYIGGEELFKTTDNGMNWTAISPDLTRNDKSKQQSSGGPITQDNTSVEYYDTIFTIAESPKRSGMIWVGTDDGLIQLTTDGGQHWTNVTPKDMPEWSRVSLIEASPHDASTAYAAVDRHELDDVAAYIYKTTDSGKTWTRINKGIPQGSFVHTVREDPERRGLLFAGTETGVYVSSDDGGNWRPLKNNLPPTRISDLVIKGKDVVVATHGRSFWALDDITPLRQFTPEIPNQDAHLYRPAATYRVHPIGFQVPRHWAVGKNPPDGVIIYYQLKTELKKQEPKKDEKDAGEAKEAKEEASPVTLEILDGEGKVIRRYPPPQPLIKVREAPESAGEEREEQKPKAPPAEAGLNRFVWNLRYEDATKIPNSPLWAGSTAGPLVLPGTYQVKLTVEGKSYTAPIEIRMDPRVTTSQAELEKQFQLAMQIHQRLSETNDAVNQMRELRRQINAVTSRLAENPGDKPVIDAGKQLENKIKPIEEALVQVKSRAIEDVLNYPIKLNNQLAALASMVEGADTAPTKQDYEAFDTLERELQPQLAAWKSLLNTDVPAFNALVERQQVPALALPQRARTATAP